jgi:hypothetical protein
MTIEDQLRDRLHDETTSLRPPGDLLESLARRHALRNRRARLGLAGASLTATALVAALFVSLLSAPPKPTPPLNGTEVIQRARAADAAADGMIVHFVVNYAATYNVQQVWALRSEQRGRSTYDSGSTGIVMTDKTIQPPGVLETIDHLQFTVRTISISIDTDPIRGLLPGGTGDLHSWLYSEPISVSQAGGEIHLVSPGDRMPPGGYDPALGTPMGEYDMTLDPATYLPKRVVFQNPHITIDLDWLPATPQNRQYLEHTVPPGYQRTTS